MSAAYHDHAVWKALIRFCIIGFGLFWSYERAVAQINVGPGGIGFTTRADSFFFNGQLIGIGSIGGESVPFSYTPVPVFGKPDFIVVSPSTGVTPATVSVAPNPNVAPYLAPTKYIVFVEFSTPGHPCPPCPGTEVTLTVAPPPPPAVTAVVSVATLQPDISPGELVSIMGTNLSTPPITSQYDGSGLYPTLLGNTKVTFNGTPAPLLYVSTGQVDAVVPYGVAGANSLNVIVTHYGVASPAFSIPLVDTSPGICIASQSCSKEGGILNAASRSLNMVTPNNAEIPAPKGSAITIFATGAGLWKRSVPDGSVVLNAFPPSVPFSLAPAAPVSLTIGGLPATILYAGSAPFKVSGVLQVNAVVPDGVDSGPQPVVLTIGERNNSQQQLTVAVQ